MTTFTVGCPWCREHGQFVCLTVSGVRILAMDKSGHLTVYEPSRIGDAVTAVMRIIEEQQAQMMVAMETINLYTVMTGALGQYVGDHNLHVASLGTLVQKEGKA